RRTATAIAATLDVPVFLYEEAATAAHRRRLDQIRAGGLPGLAERMLRPDWAPDAGPARPHPSAGVFVIGARRPLVAYNVDLDTRDMAAATAIARQVRARDGGLPGVKALPMWLAHRDRAQVSMNLTDLEQTTAAQAFDAVVHAAATAGIRVAESEVVGLIPEAALGGRTPADLRIANWTGDLLLEAQLQRAGLIS
ncbi:MAG: glutamate formiminotransferase, partial [Alphaproteobacteria bacterium]